MADKLKNLPIEERFVELETEGKVVLVPALNRTWVKLAEKNFTRYISHPDPGHNDFIEDRALWLEITHFVVEDLEWLLRQEHHIFWSHMIYSMEAQWLILTFLQEAPPYYMRNEFPKDEEMENAFAKAEHLAFLVLRRLATRKESPEHHIRNFGDLLYNSYLFTIPMFFDIFSIYGYKNRQLVAKLFHDVVSMSPKFLHDLEIVPHFFMKVLQMVKEKFDVGGGGTGGAVATLNEKYKLKPDLVKNIFLHLLDTTANMQIFFDINTNYAKCMRSEIFLSEVAFFYTYIIPKINAYIKKNNDSAFESFKEKLDFIRLNLLSIVRSIFCCTINDVVNDERNREEYANEYLTRLMDIIQEPLFISDYNKVYPIDNDLRMLRDLCPNMDTVNLKYISEAVASCSITKYKPDHLKEFRLATLISEVRDILPHLGDGFVEFCLKFYDFNTEKVVTAIIEGTLPPSLDKLDRNMERPNQNEQKIIRARISAEKQYRMDRAGTSGVKTAPKEDKSKTCSESEGKAEKAGTSAEGDEKANKPGTSAEGEERADKPGTSAEGEEKADKPGTSGGNKQKGDKLKTCSENEEKADKAGASGMSKQKGDKLKTCSENEGKMDKAGASAEGEQRADKPGTSGGSKQKGDKAGANGGSKHKGDKAGTSAEGEQKLDKPGTSGGGKKKADRAGTSGRGKQKADKAGASGGGKQKADRPGTSGEGEQKLDRPGTSGGGRQRADRPGTSGESKQRNERAGTSGESKAKNDKTGAGAAANKEMVDFFNDKHDVKQIKDKILHYSRENENYEDEYDDTYDDKSLFVKEGRNVEEEKRTGARRRVFRNRDTEMEEKSSEDESADNPASIRARLLQRRMDKLRRDFIASKKAQIQEREVLINRRFKDVHKSTMANHNRKNCASRKRNMNLGNS